VRFDHDTCTISVDTSGDLLHRRGYRKAVAKAPLRETLAAAMLAAARWDGERALLDPLCGSGTICIEGAMIARRMPAGAKRRFAFMDWPDFSRSRWDALLGRAFEEVRDCPVAICGSDRDAGAIEAAVANARRAGVDGDVEFLQRPLSALTRLADAGALVTNPPFGVRVGKTAPLRDMYARLGTVARRELSGWSFGLLGADPALERQIGLDLESAVKTSNGGIPVRILVGRVP